MRDPYEILGVPRNATEEQINAAYREKARALQDMGADDGQLEELNNAYDSVIMQRASGGYTYAGSYGSTDYADIRDKIRAGRLEDAQILLDGIPDAQRDAEWFYLKGTVQQKRGWLEEAANNFARAAEMDPGNKTYQAAYKQVNQARSGGYRTERRAGRDSGCSACDICSGLLCADCCCECMGGDLIPCC
ncbi:MAG: J domain-containing protein [Clostridia bacterium]|nr:J domain-containing protein [Clostridia bacterium]